MMGNMDISEDLYDLTMQGQWSKVADIYKNANSHKTKLTKSEDTALHIAISTYNNHPEYPSRENVVQQMIERGSSSGVLKMKNVRGETPLHLAAAIGWVNICIFIASKDRQLIGLRNADGETPLFLAAHHGNLPAFLWLHDKYYNCPGDHPRDDLDERLWRRIKDGNTILHSAISAEYFGLAYQIIEQYHEELVNSVNVNGESPLHVLARKSNVFLSIRDMGLYDSIIHQCVFVDKLKKKNVADNRGGASEIRPSMDSKTELPENYRTCLNVFRMGTLLLTGLPLFKKRRCKSTDEENQRRREENEADTKEDHGFFPPNYTTCALLFKFAMKVILVFLGIGFWRIKKIRDRKEVHSHALQIMEKLIDLEQKYKYENTGERPDMEMEHFGTKLPELAPEPDSQNEKSAKKKTEKGKTTGNVLDKDTPILVAAKMGILEIVDRIIRKIPVAIQDLDSNGKNVLMLAAANRQRRVFNYLVKSKGIQKRMLHHLDNEGNNLLHHAARLGKQLQPWRIPGAALQMQWEIKWYKYVKENVPPQCAAHQNTQGETPKKIFTCTHEELMKRGSDWLIKTSESCSIVAALIAAVAFATSSTVPGGLEESTGYPVLRDNPSFGIFAIASLAALCLSVTALVFFLSIITSRCEKHDFKISLPRKLLVGLTSLFASIASILLSFCAGHKFILKTSLRFAAVPIYAVASVPVVLFAFAQMPLYLDLLRATWRKVPQRSYKVF